ncbi:MAG: 2-C-methyl-D-erythritol 4-phosphate cytidylyltransferase [Bacteroidota bacterium]
MKKYAIIVAGGSGTRMKSKVPKQFLIVDEEPIIIQTIRKFILAIPDLKLIVVLPPDEVSRWEKLKSHYPIIREVEIAMGGSTRTTSVLSGLSKIEGGGLVAIHDAVRPHVEPATIISSYESAEINGSGVAAVPLKDSIRELFPKKKSKARNRNNYVLVQTPQTFDIKKLKKAYAGIGDLAFTDDASVYEHAGEEVFLVEGSHSNIKITTPDDLK